jgi:hypothetical protein
VKVSNTELKEATEDLNAEATALTEKYDHSDGGSAGRRATRGRD